MIDRTFVNIFFIYLLLIIRAYIATENNRDKPGKIAAKEEKIYMSKKISKTFIIQ